MIRIVAQCKYINVDTVLGNLIDTVKKMQEQGLLNNLPGNMKLPPFVNSSMFKMLPQEQKLNLIATGINQEKGKLLQSMQTFISNQLGQIALKDISMTCDNQTECMATLRLDVESFDTDKSIDLLIEKVLKEDDLPEILGEHFEEGLTMDNIGFYMHGQADETKEYLAIKSMSVEKLTLMKMLEDFAASKEVDLTMANLKFLMK